MMTSRTPATDPRDGQRRRPGVGPLPRSLFALAFAGVLALLGVAEVQAQTLADDELALATALDEVRAGRVSAALKQLDTLVERNPNFRLAQLVYADLLLASAGRPVDPGAVTGAAEDRLEGLRAEAQARMSHLRSLPSTQLVPAPLLAIAPTQRRVILIDQRRSRLYLFENRQGQPRLIGDYYVSTGKKGALKQREGDQRTPVGVYFVTSRLQADTLDDFYGAGALPVNYPNEWDDRYGRTGYGIWIHGVPSDTYSRPPRASDGCIALPNGDLEPLLGSIDVGNTPVVITDGFEWLPAGDVAARRRELQRAIEAWRRDRESRDPMRYGRHYAADFSGDGMTRAQWMDHQLHDAKRGRELRMRIEDLGLYAYPGERDLVVASFQQGIEGDSSRDSSARRQYWRRDLDGQWRIVYEGDATFRPEHFRGIPWSARSRLTQLEN